MKQKVDLIFNVTGNDRLYNAVVELTEALGGEIQKVKSRKVIRVSLDKDHIDTGYCGSVAEATATYSDSVYNPIFIGDFAPLEIKLPDIGEYKVVATATELRVGCQHIPWDVVQKCLYARPK